MKNRHIRKVAILGSGVMGSRIACHFANVGCEVLLLDISPKELNELEIKKGLTLDAKDVKNRIVNDALSSAINSTPSPIYSKKNISKIHTGNFDENLSEIANCDWILEVVIERLDIKKGLFEKVEKYRKNGTLISSNTSGIPIHLMTEGRSEDFKKHFAGTHFFNPPRYLPLLEIIPTKDTDQSVLSFYENFGSTFLGKTTVICKDTPAFIANRVGVYSIMSLFNLSEKHKLSVEAIDKLTGPVIGRPKSATFRTCDVVGIDTLALVAGGLEKACPNDEENNSFKLPLFVSKMIEKNWLGSKTNQGFFKKTKTESGEKQILALNLNSMEYAPSEKVKFASLEQTKSIDSLEKRIQLLLNSNDQAGLFYKEMFGGIFAYVANRIPEISEEIYKIDDAICAGFGWEIGPFETWDVIGVQKGIELAEAAGKTIPSWIKDLAKENKTFFKKVNGQKLAYNPSNNSFEETSSQKLIQLKNTEETAVVWRNTDCRLVDLGDGVLNLEFNTKMNTIGGGVIQGINKSIDIAEEKYAGLIISNQGPNFSAGANVPMIFMMAVEQEYEELNFAVKAFQDTMMRIRYSNIPVIVAPHGLTLGGGCELSMHADKVITHSETYMGLVEFGVGLIPGGGGSKEFAKRLSDELKDGDIKINRLRERFLTIGQAKVSTSGEEAFELGYLRYGIDEVCISKAHQLTRSKEAVLEFVQNGYLAPKREKNISVMGQEGLGIVYVGANSMRSGNYMSDHDQVISEKLGFVLCGGDLSENTLVSEQYLLDLERKAFVELCMQRKTLERLSSLVNSGKILRN